MSRLGSAGPALVVLGLALSGPGCKPPTVTLKPRPAASVELDLRLKGHSKEDGERIAEGLRSRLEVPVRQADVVDPVSRASSDLQSTVYRFATRGDRRKDDPEGTERILQVVLRGGEPVVGSPNMGKIMAVSTGAGALVGAGAGMYMPTPPESALVGAGLGGVAGLATSPWTFRHMVRDQKELGYVPYDYYVLWRALRRNDTGGEVTLAAGSGRLDDRKWLHPLPAPSSREDIARENQRACLEALEREVKARLAAIQGGQAMAVSRLQKTNQP